MGKTEKQKMLAGELYRADDAELSADRSHCRALVAEFNSALDESARGELLRQLLGRLGENVTIQSPFACDYGYNISIGSNVFVNYGTVILDCAPVSIEDHAQIGPGVQVLAADHPRDPELRRSGVESALPVIIQANAWIGGGAILCPGVTVGKNSIIGAGSVVTRAIPPDVIAVGNPCRVVGSL